MKRIIVLVVFLTGCNMWFDTNEVSLTSTNDVGDADVPTRDFDGDTIVDSEDNCPMVANLDQADADEDGVGDVCDNCPTVANADQNPTACDCVSEAPDLFCTRMESMCGTIVGLDNCNRSRTVDCGSCTLPETCGGGGTMGMCGCTPSTPLEFCNANNANCGNVSAVDNCGSMRIAVPCGGCMGTAKCSTENRCDCRCNRNPCNNRECRIDAETYGTCAEGDCVP